MRSKRLAAAVIAAAMITSMFASSLPANAVSVQSDEAVAETSGDALALLRMSIGIDEYSPDMLRYADIDKDGEITSADGLALLRFSVGMGEL